MIINIRGTSGSGKTYLVRRLLALSSNWSKIERPGFRKYLGYQQLNPRGGLITVAGRYSVACGGVDDLPFRPRPNLFRELQDWADAGDLVMEGLLLSEEVLLTAELAQAHETHIIFLSTPLRECLSRINARRKARGVLDAVNPGRTQATYRKLFKVRARLADAGAGVYYQDAEAAFRTAAELLGWA